MAWQGIEAAKHEWISGCTILLLIEKWIKLRQDPPWFEFLVIFDFLHGIEKVETHLLGKFHKKILVKCATEVAHLQGFYTKLYTKTAVSESSMALGRFNLTFLPLDYLYET